MHGIDELTSTIISSNPTHGYQNSNTTQLLLCDGHVEVTKESQYRPTFLFEWITLPNYTNIKAMLPMFERFLHDT